MVSKHHHSLHLAFRVAEEEVLVAVSAHQLGLAQMVKCTKRLKLQFEVPMAVCKLLRLQTF